MDILSLSKQLEKDDFSDALDIIKQVNGQGVLVEFIESVNQMVEEGTDLMSSIHYAYYDLLINPETGKFK